MQITYTPKEGDGKSFHLDPDDYSTDEAEAIEGAGGGQWDTFGTWVNQINRGGFRALRVALWVYLARSNPALGLEEVKPRVSEFQITLDDDIAESAEGKSETGDGSTDSP